MEPNIGLLSFHEEVESPLQGKPPSSFYEEDSEKVYIPRRLRDTLHLDRTVLVSKPFCNPCHLPEMPFSYPT